MRTIDAHLVLQGAMALLTGQGGSAGVPSSRFAALRGYFDRALQSLWEAEQWPDLNRIQLRRYRLDWDSGTTYAAGAAAAPVEVYFPPTDSYYQSLAGSNTNNPPATQSGSTWTTTAAWWALSAASYSGPNWAASTFYAVGTIVRRTSDSAADYRYYQCITAHTSTSTFDTAKFSILTDFDAYVGYTQTGQTEIGEVFNVTDTNPNISRGFREYRFGLSENGIQVPNGPTQVWLEFRVRRPVLTGDVWSSTGAYSVGQQVYYTTSAGIGNFYDCIGATSAGESPVTASAKWRMVQIPYIFGQALIWEVYADLLGSDGQADKSVAARNQAAAFYQMEADKLYRQQRQTKPIRVVGY